MFNGVRFRIEKTNLKTLVGTRPLAESSAFAPGIIKSTEPYCPRGGCIRRRASRPSCADRTCAGRAGRTRADRADRNCAGRCHAALEALKRGDMSWPDQQVKHQCPLWVKSGRDALKFRCPLYPRNRTFPRAVSMSALGHKQTHALQKCAATRKQKDRLAAVGLLKIRLAPIDPGQIRPSRR